MYATPKDDAEEKFYIQKMAHAIVARAEKGERERERESGEKDFLAHAQIYID